MNPIAVFETHYSFHSGCPMYVAGVVVRAFDAAMLVREGMTRAESQEYTRKAFREDIDRAIAHCDHEWGSTHF